MNVPDYVSPVVAYRAWLLGPRGLTSLNGESWHPNQELQAVCTRRRSAWYRLFRSVNRHRPPHGNCSCGIYAAKSFDQLRRIGYAELAVICGEVHLWGTVVEHELGWRAQFAYPKTLVVPESLLFGRLESLKILIEYGADLFVAGEKGNIHLCCGRSNAGVSTTSATSPLGLAQSRHTFVPIQHVRSIRAAAHRATGGFEHFAGNRNWPEKIEDLYPVYVPLAIRYSRPKSLTSRDAVG